MIEVKDVKVIIGEFFLQAWLQTISTSTVAIFLQAQTPVTESLIPVPFVPLKLHSLEQSF